MLEGGCYCGRVRYCLTGEPAHVSICNCSDCRRLAGAPLVSWSAFAREGVAIVGELTNYASSEHAVRQFCPVCGTSLFYTNETILPGLIDVQTATLDDPEALPPAVQVQTAERLSWMTGIADLPMFERFPAP